METFIFPNVPAGFDKKIIKPSPSFTKQVYRSLGAIALFLFTYLFLFFATLAIAAAFGFVGFSIIAAGIGAIGAILGIAMLIAGALLLFFLVKFLFRYTPTDYPGTLEIKADEQPDLFLFVNKLTAELGSPKPKRIFLSPDVNAGVSYDSNFWSMFLPVKKNLQIGLALVNSINISEFKAVMAHEFGHFSQRSMKFGSYVFNLNKVMYNMLFENDSYDKLLHRWGRLHPLFKLMAVVNIYLIRGIQDILKKVYVILNKTHLGLSREMEYHADSVAAYMSGSNQAITSLKRIEIGQLCYDQLLNYLNRKLAENKRSENLFPQHQELIKLYSANNKIGIDQTGLPALNFNQQLFSDDQIEIEDPWSSHPSMRYRQIHLNKLNINTIALTDPAWSLFRNKVELQKKITDLLYSNVSLREEPIIITPKEISEDFAANPTRIGLKKDYNDYYDNRNIKSFDIDEAMLSPSPIENQFIENVFKDNCGLPNYIMKLKNNINTLNTLSHFRKDIKYFNFNGIRYTRNEAPALQADISEDLNRSLQKIYELDQKIFVFFYYNVSCVTKKQRLADYYKKLFNYQTEASKDYDLYSDIKAAFQPIYNALKPSQIRETVTDIYAKEKIVKPRIKEVLSEDHIRKTISTDHLNAIELYLNTNCLYYLKPNYDNNAINIFNMAMDTYISVISSAILAVQNELVAFQSEFLKNDQRNQS